MIIYPRKVRSLDSFSDFVEKGDIGYLVRNANGSFDFYDRDMDMVEALWTSHTEPGARWEYVDES